MPRNVVARSNLIVFGGLTLLLALVGGLTWERQHSAARMDLLVRRTNETLRMIARLDVAVLAAETGQRGYLLTGSGQYLAPYEAALGEIAPLEGVLRRLTSDDPTQQERLRLLGPLIETKLAELAQTVALARAGRREAALEMVRSGAGLRTMTQIRALLLAMRAEERELLGQRREKADAQLVLRLWLVGILTLSTVGLLLFAARGLTQAWQEAERAEARQRALATRLKVSLESLSQGVGVFDGGFGLVEWNVCFRELLDLPGAMLRERAPYSRIAEHASWVLESEEAVRQGSSGLGETLVFERTREDGHELEVRRTALPEGGFVLTISDMTKRAQSERVLREAQRMHAIGQLTGGIAHDFNNLLTVILGNLEFIRARPEDRERVLIRVERANWAAQRAATLTRQLLAFARKQPLSPVPVDLTSVVPDVVPLLERTLGETVAVTYVEAAGLWPAMADPAQLESALLNLALNARDAMPAGGRLTIELANKVLGAEYAAQHAEVTAGDYAMLAVSDTGQGMSPNVLARAFEPFFTTKTDGKGTGLGLAMVYGFVKQSGGHIKIYSEVGEGTTVRLYLPRAEGEALVAARDPAPVAVRRGSETILLVEDEPSVREVAGAMLRELGYRVLEAVDGEDALLVFAAQGAGIELLVTDVVLPGGLRGRDVAERLRGERPGLGVLFMSGYTENSIVHNGRLDEGVHLISKPFTREDLAAKVAEVLGRQSSVAGD